MPYINTTTALPLKSGAYKCLIDIDGLNTLDEADNQVFNGKDWDTYESNCQYIRYWWADKEDYAIISAHIESEIELYQQQLEKESKNFGGL